MINESHVEVFGYPSWLVYQKCLEKFDLFHLGPLKNIFLKFLSKVTCVTRCNIETAEAVDSVWPK